MTLTILSASFLVANLILTVAIFWYRGLSNPQLLKTNGKLSPIQTKKPFFRPYNGLFDLLDRVPFLRRSGTGNEFDLFKTLVLTSVPVLAIQLIVLQPGLPVVLLSIGVALLVLNLLLLIHPVLKPLSR
jgi:hypothetical protein